MQGKDLGQLELCKNQLCVCVAYLGNTWLQYAVWRKATSMKVWTMFCWEPLGPAIHKDATCMHELQIK